MANSNGGRINFDVNMNVNKNSLNDLIKPLQQVQTKLNSMSQAKIDPPLRQAASAAKQLESIINSSWNDKLNQLNLDKFNQSVKTSFNSLSELKNTLSGAGAEGDTAFNSLATSVLNTNLQLRESNRLLDSMAVSMANTVKWGITSSIFNNITGSIQKAYYYAKDLDTSLNDIRIVTGDSADQMQRFAKTANDAAKDLGRSTLDYTKAALGFYQQGLSDQEVAARTDVTLKAQNITGGGTQMVDQLTAVWNGFNVSTEDTQGIVDKLAKVADSSASNMSELATAMSKVAATANTMGVDVDQLTAQLATVIATTRQAPESVGTAFKTIYSRLNDIKTGADDAQISLGNYSGKMAELGFSVLDANGELRDTGQVIEQIGSRWDTLSKAQQIYLAETMGGVRQVTQVVALFDNWTKYSDLLNTSLSAQGTLNQKNDIYLQSTAAHLEQLGAEAERTYAALFDMDTVNTFVDGLNGMLTVFNDFIEGIGGGASAFIYFGTVVANVFSKQIADAILKVKDNFDKIQANKAAESLKDEAANLILGQRLSAGDYDTSAQQAATQAAKKQAQIYQQIASVKQNLTQQTYNELTALQKTIGINTQRIQMIRDYQAVMNQVTGLESASQKDVLDAIEQRKNAIQQEETLQQEVLEEVRQYVDTIKESHTPYVENQDALNHIEDLTKSIALDEEERNRLAQIHESMSANEKITDEDIKFVHEAINKELQYKKKLLDQANEAYKLSKEYVQGEDKNLEEANKSAERLLENTVNRAKQSEKMREAVRDITAGLASATAIVSSIAKYTEQGATGAEKANAAWAGIQGSLPGIAGIIANQIAPGTGRIVSTITAGVIGLGKAFLEATGLWDKLEYKLSSFQEKVQNLKEDLSNVGQIERTDTSKIGGLKEIQEEWESLYQKYNEDRNSMTEEQIARYHELTNQFSNYNESVIAGYDEQGNAIIANQNALSDTIKILQEQKQAALEAAYAQNGSGAQKLATADELLFGSMDIEGAQKNLQAAKNSWSNALLQVSGDMISQYDKAYELLATGINNNNIFDLTQFFTKSNLFDEEYDFIKDTLEEIPSTIGDFLLEIRNALNSGQIRQPEQFDILIRIFEKIQNIPGMKEDQGFQQMKEAILNISALGDNLKEYSLEVDKAEALLEEAKQNKEDLQNGLIKFNEGDLRAALKYDTDYNQAFKKLLSLDSIDSNFVNQAIDDFLSGWTAVGNLDDANVTQKLAASYEQIIGFGQQYAENLYEALSQSEDVIASAFESFDSSKIESMGREEYKKYIEGIVQGIINQIDVSSLSAQARNALQNYLSLIFNVSDIDLKTGEVITNSQAIVQKYYDSLISGLKEITNARYGDQLTSILSDSGISDWLNTLSDQQLSQISSIIQSLDYSPIKAEAEAKGIQIGQVLYQALTSGLETKQAEQKINTIQNNIDQIASMISSIQSGKYISIEQKMNLIEALGITDEELQHLQTNEDWLEKLTEDILSLQEGSIQRIQGLQALYPTINALQQAFKGGIIGENEYKSILPEIMAQQIQSLNISMDALKEYADLRHMAFDTQQQQAQVLATYKQGESLEALSSAIGQSGQQIKKYAENKASLHQSYDAITSVRQAWEQLTGENVSTDWIIRNIDAITAAADKSFESVQELYDFIKNYNGEDAAKSLSEIYDQGRNRVTQGKGAEQALMSGTALTSDQSKALVELQQVNSALADIARQQGINSQAYLMALDAAIEKQRQLNEETRQAALEETQVQIQHLQREKSLQNQLDGLQNITQEEYQQALQLVQGNADLNNKISEQNTLLVGNNNLAQNRIQLDEQTLRNAEETIQKYQHKQELQKQLAQVQENILEGQGDLNQLKARQLELMQQIADQSQRRLDDDVDRDKWEDLSDYLQEYADQIQGVSDQVKDNVQAADDLAQAILRYDAALESVGKNYDNWQKMLTSGSIQDAVQAGEELQDVYSDLLDLPFENLSPDFTQSLDNLQLLKQAANGSEQAYNQLRQAAMQDILTHFGIDDSDFQNGFADIKSKIDAGIDDIEVGAFIDDTQAIQAMNQLINAAGMTADQATDLLASMGVDAEVEQTQVPESQKQAFISAVPTVSYQTVQSPIIIPTPLGGMVLPNSVQVPTINYGGQVNEASGQGQKTTTALRVTSARKSSGGNIKFNNSKHGGGSGRSGGGGRGKGGGGGKGKSPKKGGGSGKKSGTEKTKDPKVQKALEDKQDRYHDINIEIKHINDELQKIQQNEEKLTGKALIDNLNKQLKVLNKQIDAYQTKLQLERQQRDQLKNSLAKQGVKFDVDGDITNYSTILSEKLKAANDIIAQYNAMSAEQQQKHKDMVEKAKKDYQDFKDSIENYDKLISEEIPGLEKDIRDMRDQMVEKQIQKFKINVDLQLDTSEAERDFNAFKKKVIDQISDEDILGNTLASFKDLSSYYKAGPDVIDALTNQVNGTLEQLLSIDRTGDSSVYGDNKAAALQDLKKYTDELMQNLEDIEDLIQDIKDSIFDAIDAAQDAFDTQVDEYEFISDILDHNIKMTELLYGDDAYETMSKYYSMQQQNNNKQLDFLRRQKDMWFSRMVQEQERMSELDVGSKAFKEAEERFEEYKNHWMDAVDDLNSKLEDSLENIIDKYANAIDLAFDKLDKKLTDGKGLDYIGEEWELINKQADLYLDTVNSMYEIEKLGNAYEDAIKDNEGDLKAQKSLTSMMKEQLAYLKDKDKLTQYDVDRANALLQIELKRLALEQQRQNKTKLRLRRDSQGNYTYQYTVDKESVQGAEQELRDAEVSLYNMTKEAYKNNLDSYYDTVSDWQDRVKQVYKDTTLTAQEQQQKIAMLNEYYGGIINEHTKQNQELKLLLMKDTFDELSRSYGTNVENFQKMSDDQKEILMKQMIPYWDSGIQHMATKFSGQGGFLPTVAGTFGEIKTATEQYQKSLGELQEAAGANFKGIAFAIDEAYQEAKTLTEANKELIRSYNDQITAIDKVIGHVYQLSKVYQSTKMAATAATEAAFEYWQQENKNSIAMVAKQKTNSTPAKKSSSSNSSSGNKSSSSSSSSGNKSSSSGSGNKSSSSGSGSGNSNGSSKGSALQKASTTVNNWLKSFKIGSGKTGGVSGSSWSAGKGIMSGNQWKKVTMATGGYTGSWGSEGRLAVLHEKELVLNKEDTSNILQAVAVVRTMNDMLSEIRSNISLANVNNSGNYPSNGAIDQNVKIEAHFPNVKDHSEIEQALNNLVNQASQFAFKN